MKRLLVLCLVLGSFAQAQEQAPAGRDLASLLPAETLLVCEGDDLGGLDRWARETALGRLWSEPEVQHFAQRLMKSLTPAFDAAGGPLGIIGLTMDDLRGIRVRRGGFAVVDASLGDGGLHLDLVLYLEFREGADKARKVLQALRQAAQAFAAVPFEEIQVGDSKVWRAQVLTYEVFLSMEGDRLLVTTQRERMAQLLLAVQADGHPQSLRASPRYAKIRERMGAGRFAFLMYADVPRIVARATGAAGRLHGGEQVAEFTAIWRKLGLDAMESVAVADIPSGTGFRTELAVTFRERRGVFALAQPGRPDNRFARYAPAHSLFYGAERFDLAAGFDTLLGLTEAFGMHGEVDGLVERANAALGVDLREDVAAALGTEWAGYLAGPPEGGLIPDYALLVSVRDRARLEKALDTIAARLPALAEEEGVVRVDETYFRGVRIRFLELSQKSGDPIPLAPAWALGDGFLVLALVPQTIKHVFLEKRSMQGSDAYRTLLRRIPPSSASHTYVDMQGLVAWIYNSAVPLLQVFQGAINAHLARFCDGMRMGRIQLNFQDLPPAEVLTRHLGGAMFYSAVEGDCVRAGYVSDFGATLLVAPFMMIGMAATFVATGEREAALRARERAQDARQRRAQVQRLRKENALLRKRLAAIEQEIAEIKRLLEEQRR